MKLHLLALYRASLNRARLLNRTAPQSEEPRPLAPETRAERSESFDDESPERSVEILENQIKQQAALTTLAQQALAEIDVSELLDKVVNLVAQTLQVDYVDVVERLPQSGELQLRATASWEAAQSNQNRSPRITASVTDYVLQNRQSVVISNLRTEQRFLDLQVLQELNILSTISVLVTDFGKPFGILSVYSKAQRSFFRDEILFLEAVAGLISAAIDRDRIESVMAQAEAALARSAMAETAKQALEQEISQRQQIEAALRESEERYVLATNAVNDGFWDWNLCTNEIYFSARWKAMLGYAESEMSSNPNEWFDRIHPDDYERVQLELRRCREKLISHFESEFRLRHKDQSYCWVLSRGLVVCDAAGNVTRITGSQSDITARKQAEERLIYNALHDDLTGLANRTLFADRLDRAIAQMNHRHSRPFAVVFLDLDRFKIINDSLGHLVGDQLLSFMAERLKQCLRSSDTCARLGGDEFAILLEDLQSSEDALLVIEHIQVALKAPFILAGREVFVSASIGLVLDTERYRSKEELLRDADTAMYHSKAAGRGCTTVFTLAMHEQAMELLHLEADLRRAVERQELCLFYQPIFALNNQSLIGFEALLRWQHPERGLLLPADFLAVAEETGLIVSIGGWVLSTACEQMQQWQQQFQLESHIAISVNLSGKQFAQPDLVEQVARVLETSGLEPQRLKLEITENVLMIDADAAAAMMQQLKALGIKLAIDDFGTGYSSLSYLHRFPIDMLKIDQSFINSTEDSLEKLEITRTVIALAWNLGVDVVAEGVETERQMAQLKLLRCELGQGFLLSYPLDQAAASALLEHNSAEQGF